MAFNKKAEREFVNDLDSFSEKKRPVFELGKDKSFLSNYTSAANIDIYSTDFLKREISKPDDGKPVEPEKEENTFNKKLQGVALKEHTVNTERSVKTDSSVKGERSLKPFESKNSRHDTEHNSFVSGKTRKGIISSYTDTGGGAFFETERQENGEFRESRVHLNKFKDRTDKQEFKSKAAHVFDVGERAAETVKPEENEAAASNVDEKAIIATVILRERFKDEKKRLSKVYLEKREETRHLQEIVHKEQQEFLTHGQFSESNAEFVDKGERFSDKYLCAFRDKSTNFFGEEYTVSNSSVVDALDKRNAAQAAIQQKMEKESSVFSQEQSFERKNELNNRHDDVNALSMGKEAHIEGKFSETTVKADDNKGKKSVSSYFSNESETEGIGKDQMDKLTSEEKLDLSRSEKKSVKKAKNEAIRKAAAIAAVSNMLRVKKELQNDVGDMNSTGDLMRDGRSGMLRAAINGIKNVVVNQIRGLLIKIAAAVMAGLMHILVLAAPLIVVVVIVIAIMTTFLSVFTDSSNIPDGDGYVYSSLTGTEIDDVIDGLYLDFPAEMNSTNESLLRYALSKVGCAYDQKQHWNLTVDIFDCSSLAYRAYKEVGIDISNDGIYSAAEICREATESGFIAAGNLRPGDLIFYGGRNNGRYLGVYHVAIYVGNGKMVEARGRSSGVVYCDVRTDHVVGYSRYI